MRSRAVTSHLMYALPLVLFTGLAAVSLSSQGLVVYRYFHDTFVVFDAMWRASLGQTPHIDFPSPLGQAYYWPFAALAALGDTQVTTLLRANVLVAAVVVAFGYLTLPRRLPPLAFGLAILTGATIAMTPRDLDGWIDSYSFLAPYNTWAWALVTLPALIALVPPRDPPTLTCKLVDGVVLGLTLGLLFYLKITFFGPAVGCVVVGLILRHLSLAAAGLAAATLLAMVLGIEFTMHNNAAYLADLKLVAEVNVAGARGARPEKLLKNIALAAAAGSVLLAALWLWAPNRNLATWVRLHWRAIFVAAVIIGAGALIATQNHPKFQVTLIGIGAIAGAELARRASTTSPSRTQLALGWGLVLALTAPPALLDAASVVGHADKSRSQELCRLSALGGPDGGMLVRPLAARERGVPIGPATCGWLRDTRSDIYEAPGFVPVERLSLERIQRFESSIPFLAMHGAQKDVILVSGFSNPYPLIFGTPPPTGAAIWWDYDRDFSLAAHPPAAPMMRSATVVLEARNEWNSRRFWRVYGEDVMRNYQVVGETPQWRLWRKRDPANRTTQVMPDRSR